MELGWDLVDVTVGLSPSGDLGNGASWVFFVGNGDGGDLKVSNLVYCPSNSARLRFFGPYTKRYLGP